MSNTEEIPAGMWQDAQGRLVPEKMVKPIDRKRDALVRKLIKAARVHSAALAKFKGDAFEVVAGFMEASAAEYDVKMGGAKGNITLQSFDGSLKIVRQVQDTIAFDERLQVAKKLIDNCISRWADGSKDEIKVLINDAFQVNKEGRINTGRILALKRLNIRDEEWKRAMGAIQDSVQISSSKSYIRFYERVGNTDQFRAISLDVAAV